MDFKIMYIGLFVCFLLLFFGCSSYALSSVMTKTFPEVGKNEYFAKWHKIILYSSDEKLYTIYYFQNEDIRFITNKNNFNEYLLIKGFWFKYVYFDDLVHVYYVEECVHRYRNTYIYNIRGHPSDKSVLKQEVIYCDLDIKYDDTNNCFFRKTPDFKSAIMQRAFGRLCLSIIC